MEFVPVPFSVLDIHSTHATLSTIESIFCPRLISLNLSESSTTGIFLLFGSILVGLGPDIDAINGQDDVYLEFVPVLSSRYTLNSCNAINSSEFAIAHHCTAITTHNPLSKEMSCHHFPNWAQFFTHTHIDNQNHLQQINIDFIRKLSKHKIYRKRVGCVPFFVEKLRPSMTNGYIM